MVSFLLETVPNPGFSWGGGRCANSQNFASFFAENCMKMKKFGPPGSANEKVNRKTSVGILKSKKCHNGSIMVSPRIFATAVHDCFNCKTDPSLNGSDRRLILPFSLIWRCDCEPMQSFFVCSLCHLDLFFKKSTQSKLN